MPMQLNKDAILKWFTGKGREKAAAALAQVQKCLDQGFWDLGVSRSARAALTKANVASKLARKNDWLEKIRPDSYPHNTWADRAEDGWELSFMMRYTAMERMKELNIAKIRAKVPTEEGKKVVDQGAAFITDFLPLAKAFEELDSRRPPPVFTSIGVSPLLTETLRTLRIDADPKNIQVCPSHVEWVTRKRKDGTTVQFPIQVLDWPEGTIHGASPKGCMGLGCEACGHAIRNPRNWVPLVLTQRDGKLISLWTGRDCAQSLFGVKMTGDALWEGSGIPQLLVGKLGTAAMAVGDA
jgi:hypothetical protein